VDQKIAISIIDILHLIVYNNFIMKLDLFDYKLPQNLIANEPASPRDSSRLLIFNKKENKIIHDEYINLDKYLTPNDVLVFNNSKVFPARLIGKKETGGRVEILLLKQISTTPNQWEALIGTKKPKDGLKLMFSAGLTATIWNSSPDKTWFVEFNFKANKFNTILDKIGQVPLPPYIEAKSAQSKIKKQYQTVYANKTGSAAAPTAGLHFTNRLLKKIQNKGIQTEYVTLHVGLGTFNPVETNNIEDYKIHSEFVSIDKKTIQRLQKAKEHGKRIIAVGTTSVRVLETVFTNSHQIASSSFQSSSQNGCECNTNIFIYPGYKFKFIDAMITNFHLPKSSLIMLVSAFIGRKKTLDLYKLAIKLKYRFFSFGDGMFLS